MLTDQAGFDDFVADGGLQLQQPDSEVWFWYNPLLDCIIQKELAPYDVRGSSRRGRMRTDS